MGRKERTCERVQKERDNCERGGGIELTCAGICVEEVVVPSLFFLFLLPLCAAGKRKKERKGESDDVNITQ
jgi:hypothetical protein